MTYDVTIHLAGPCKHCGGTGQIVLLTSSRPCEFCGGRGNVGELTVCSYLADTEPKELVGQMAMVSQTSEVLEYHYGYGEPKEQAAQPDPATPTSAMVTMAHYYHDEQDNLIGYKTYTQEENGSWRLTDSWGEVPK